MSLFAVYARLVNPRERRKTVLYGTNYQGWDGSSVRKMLSYFKRNYVISGYWKQ